MSSPTAEVKHRKRKRTATATTPMPSPPVESGVVAERRMVSQPQLRLISELLRDHPHTQVNSGCGQATSRLVAVAAASRPPRHADAPASSVEDKVRSTLLRATLHFDASQDDPLMGAFLGMRERLAAPAFRIDGQIALPTTADATHHLRMEAVSLPVLAASHESRLLCQSGTFVFPLPQGRTMTRTFPPCANGQRCLASAHWDRFRGHGLAEPIVLMRAMSPHQLAQLERTGALPPGQSPCVLCHRDSVDEYVHFHRSMVAQLTPQLRLDLPREVAQLWCNPIDCADGYKRDYAIEPRPDEIVVSPMCGTASWGITSRRSACGQWRMDQSSLLWHAPDKQQTEVVAHPSTHLVRASVVSHDAVLLRNKSTLSTTTTTTTEHVSLAWLSHRVRLDGSYDAARLIDALRHAHTPLLQLADWESCVNSYTLPDVLRRAVCNASFFGDIAHKKDPLEVLMSKALNSRCQARKYGTVAEKCLLATPLQTQRYAAILARWKAQRESDQPSNKHEARHEKYVDDYRAMTVRRRQFRQLVLCSLLGNYPHCRTRVHGHQARRALYRLMGPESSNQSHHADLGWFQSLLHGCAGLVVWCVRDFMVHTLLGDIALSEQVGDMIHFAQFAELTQQAMGTARRYIDDNIARTWSPLGASVAFRPPLLCTCLTSRTVVCIYARAWTNDMSLLLQPYHERMLANQYYKPRIDAVAWLVSCEVRKASPLVPRQFFRDETPEQVRARVAATTVVPSDDEEGEGDEDEDEEGESAVSARALLTRMATQQQQQQATSKKKPAVVARDTITNAHVYLSPVQFRCLRQLVDASNTLDDVVAHLRSTPGFGFTHETCVFITQLLEHHRVSSVAKQTRMRLLVQLQRGDPHAYNLLQVACELLKERGPDGSGGRLVGHLSAETTEAQIAAASNKLLAMRQHLHRCMMSAVNKLRDDPGCHDLDVSASVAEIQADLDAIEASHRALGAGAVEASSVQLYFCTVCNTVYSNVRTSDRSRKFYRYGMQNALRRYTGPPSPADSTYCRKGLVNHNGACGQEPLSSVNLLGKSYAFGRRVYQLCVGCGDIMTPDATSGYHLHGRLCSACTCAQDKERAAFDPTKAFVAALDRRCVCCGRMTTTDQSTYLFPYGVVVCRHHYGRFLTNFMASRHWATRDDVCAAIVKVHVDNKERKRRRAQPADNRRMKANKQRSRCRKA